MEKNIKANTLINIIRTISLSVISFITFPWVCRFLGETALGQYSWAVSFVTYFIILAKVGIPNFALKECVRVKDNKELLSNKVQTFLIIQIIGSLFSIGLMSLIVFSFKDTFTDPTLIFILSINFLAGTFSFEWLYIALEKQFYMSIRNIMVLALSAILIVVFVKSPEDLYIYALCTASVTVLTVICNIILIFKNISFKKTMPWDFKSCLKPLLILLGVTLLISLYDKTDSFILGLIDESKVEVSNFSIAVKGVDIIVGIIAGLSTVYMPKAAEHYQKEKTENFIILNSFAFSVALFVILPAIVTMTILAKPICCLISGRDYSLEIGAYQNAPSVLMILAPVMLTYSLSDMIYAQILLPANKEKYYLFTLLGATVLNILLSLLFGLTIFKENPSIGVAIATALVDVIVFVILIIISRKYSLQTIFNKNNLKILISSIGVGLLTVGIKFATEAIFTEMAYPYLSAIQIVSSILIGGIVYIILLKLQNENVANNYIRRKAKYNE